METADVLNTYSGQLAWHWLLLREKANAIGADAQLFLLHYPTTGMFNADSYEFARSRRIEIDEDSVRADVDELIKGLRIIAATLPTFEWKQPEEIAAYNLPAATQEALVALKHKMDAIKAMEKEVEDTANLICCGGANFTLSATNGSNCTFPVNITIKTENENIFISNGKVLINDKLTVFDNDKGYGKKCYGGGHFSLIEAFYDCVSKKIKFPIDGEEASKVVKIILKAYKNSESSV